MSDTVIFRTEGTNCVVYSPSESAGLFIPALEMDQAASHEKVLVIAENTPVFDTLADAWAYHLQFAQAAIVQRHKQIEAEFESALYALKKKASSLHVAALVNGKRAQHG